MIDGGELIPNPRNPNTHSDEQIDAIGKVLTHQGGRAPIVVSNRSGFVIAGHGRLLAARRLGWEKVPVDVQEFDSEADEWAHMIADNRLAGLAEMDNAALKNLLVDLDTGAIDMDLTGYDHDALEELMTQFHVDEEPVDAEPQIERADELAEKWGTKLGQVWELGEHQLMCGDSTDTALVERLVGKGKAAMVFTDPPYNIDYGNIKHPKFKVRSIENDSMSDADWKVFCQSIADSIAVATEGCVYVCHAPNIDGRTIASVMDSNFHPSTTVVWNKDVFTLGRGKYQNKHEPIWFGWEKAGKAFTDRRDLANVWDLPRPKASELHPTMKPVELVVRAISHASKQGDTVFDPFLGSGTTLMACENLGRKCRGIELSPSYVAVTIERWHEATGNDPKLING